MKVKVLHQDHGENWTLYHGDSCEILAGLPDDSIPYQIYSPPFASLFTYSNSERDLGNSRSYKEFFGHLSFLIPHQFRICQPGRLISFHCADIPIMKERDGYMGMRDFPGDLLRAYEKQGFIYHSSVWIWKDPLIEVTRTKALGLSHKQIVKDSSRCRQGIPDRVITVVKPGVNAKPITHPQGLLYYHGTLPPPDGRGSSDPRTNKRAHEIWQRYASPVWFDINQTDTLQYRLAREEQDERHICPLQLQVIERCLELWSLPNETVLSPFAGIGSEGYMAVRMGRRFIGIELKESYYQLAIRNLKRARPARKLF